MMSTDSSGAVGRHYASPNELLTGRVIRLHFSCHAELPVGSFLRVTGATLWAPNHDNSNDTAATESSPTARLYASSVEMVTSPEEYPIWRTRRPVTIVVPHGRRTMQHHYYRYLVVSPGQIPERTGSEYPTVTQVKTSHERIGSTLVSEWEDPFGVLSTMQVDPPASQQQLQQPLQPHSSTVSLASTISATEGHGPRAIEYRNLPYRTVDIPVTGTDSSSTLSMPLDHWNASDDSSFQAYRIRDAIHEENRRKTLSATPRVNSGDAMDTTDSGTSTPPVFSSASRIFFVCFHLPVVVVKNESTGQWNASWSESILARTEGSTILNAYEGYWVGTVTPHPPIESDEDQQAITQILEKMKCIPIFLDQEVRQAHYYGFCKQVLWPAFHNIDLLDLNTCPWMPSSENQELSDWDQSRYDDWYKSFYMVNQVFSSRVSSLARRRDILWVHDYHLSILPQLQTEAEIARSGCATTRKVFFLHIPFPTSQIFRELECGEKLLEGMLHADVVGFHAFDHARHFLNAAKRILGLNYESLVGGLIGVNFRSRTVLVSMSNVSIEPRMVDAVLNLPSVQEGKMALRQKHKGRIIIGGVDVCQRLSGTSLKLLAYERLLSDYPPWQNRVVMVERLLLPGSRQADEELSRREVQVLVKRIIDKFGPAVIDYEEVGGNSVPMDQRLALWKASDVLMSTPIREGLNHWPMEYIFAHREPETPGVVITSEFSAVSSILNGALRVNPYDIPMAIATIDKALSMSMQEREGRRYRDIHFVSNSPSDKWVKNVLRDLRDATASRPVSSASNSQVSTPYASPTPTYSDDVHTTAAFLAQETNLAFVHLSINSMGRAYESAKRRVIILDFNGTIVLKEPPGKYLKREILGTSGNKPPPAVVEALETMSRDPRNVIYVVSGDSSENVLNALGPLKGIGIAVSNGASFSPPMQPNQKRREWFTFDLGVNWDAVKQVALPVLSKYTARSNGSFVKLTSFSIGWSYYSCDPEWGSLQAAHLVMELENELKAFDVRFVTLKGIVEILPRKLNKGLIVNHILRDTEARNLETGVDFVLCFGDDISDEKMFASVSSFLADRDTQSGPPVLRADRTVVPVLEIGDRTNDHPTHSFTVAVGKKDSHASFFVEDVQEVANSLVSLARGGIPEDGAPYWGQVSSPHMFEN